MAKKKLIVSEDDVKKKVIAPWLKSLGAWYFMPVSRGMGVHGVPDFVSCVPITITQEMVGKTVGLFVAPEAKRPDKKHNASGLQMVQMGKIDAAGGVTGVISCEWDVAHMQWRLNRILKGEEM